MTRRRDDPLLHFGRRRRMYSIIFGSQIFWAFCSHAKIAHTIHYCTIRDDSMADWTGRDDTGYGGAQVFSWDGWSLLPLNGALVLWCNRKLVFIFCRAFWNKRIMIEIKSHIENKCQCGKSKWGVSACNTPSTIHPIHIIPSAVPSTNHHPARTTTVINVFPFCDRVNCEHPLRRNQTLIKVDP